jgi:long-subunit acyl-CoA synthetase (AMP-forming)
MLTHKNLVATLNSIVLSIPLSANSYDAYLGYLPLAHVLELLCELLMCMNGVKVNNLFLKHASLPAKATNLTITL